MEYRARMMPVFGGVILLFLCASGDSVVTETALSGVDRRQGCRRGTPAGSVCPGVGGGGGRLASWASLAFCTTEAGASVPTLPCFQEKATTTPCFHT